MTTITITPLLFIPTMRRLAMLSSMGFVSTVLVTLSVAAAAVVDPQRKAIPQQVSGLLLTVCNDWRRAALVLAVTSSHGFLEGCGQARLWLPSVVCAAATRA